MLKAGWGGVFVACPQGPHGCPFCTHVWTQVLWSLTERGAEGPGWIRQACTPGLSLLPSWARGVRTENAPRGGSRNNVSRGEECASQPLASTPCFSLRRDPGFHWLSVCAHVCMDVSGHCPSGDALLQYVCPSLPAEVPKVLLDPSAPHLIPVSGDLNLCPCPNL